jgi:hypothetical protein
MTGNKVDCHYCEYAMCLDENSSVDCYADDNCYFDHHVTDSKEAESCSCFEYCEVFSKT